MLSSGPCCVSPETRTHTHTHMQWVLLCLALRWPRHTGICSCGRLNCGMWTVGQRVLPCFSMIDCVSMSHAFTLHQHWRITSLHCQLDHASIVPICISVVVSRQIYLSQYTNRFHVRYISANCILYFSGSYTLNFKHTASSSKNSGFLTLTIRIQGRIFLPFHFSGWMHLLNYAFQFSLLFAGLKILLLFIYYDNLISFIWRIQEGIIQTKKIMTDRIHISKRWMSYLENATKRFHKALLIFKHGSTWV